MILGNALILPHDLATYVSGITAEEVLFRCERVKPSDDSKAGP